MKKRLNVLKKFLELDPGNEDAQSEILSSKS